MTNISDMLRPFHDVYCSKTRRQITFDTRAIYHWEQWWARKFTMEDLVLVIDFVLAKIAKKERRSESLRLHNLIDVYRFEDDLTDARAARKPRKVCRDRESVLKSTGRVSAEQPPAKSASQVIAESAAFKDFKKWREQTGI